MKGEKLTPERVRELLRATEARHWADGPDPQAVAGFAPTARALLAAWEELADLRVFKSAAINALDNGVDEDVWPPGLTVAEAIEYNLAANDRLTCERDALRAELAEERENVALAEDEIRTHIMRYDRLTRERDALHAEVERLRELLNEAHDIVFFACAEGNEIWLDEADKALKD